MLANLTNLQIISPQMGLICWRIWRFLCKLHHFRDGPNMLANMAILASFMQIKLPQMAPTCWRIWRFWRVLC